MNTQLQRRTFYARMFSCLRVLKDVRDNLLEDLNFSLDGSDGEIELTNLRVETLLKLDIDRHLEALEEVTRRMLFEENTRLFTVTSLKILAFQRQLN